MIKNYSIVFDKVEVEECSAITSYTKNEGNLTPNFEDGCVQITFSVGHQKHSRVIKRDVAKILLNQLEKVLDDEY